MNKTFAEWLNEFYPDATPESKFTCDDMRLAFEEGYHFAQDLAHHKIEEIFNHWLSEPSTHGT